MQRRSASIAVRRELGVQAAVHVDQQAGRTGAGGQPVVRQFRTSENLILKDGQTSENLLSTDPMNGHTLRVSVTINVQR